MDERHTPSASERPDGVVPAASTNAAASGPADAASKAVTATHAGPEPIAGAPAPHAGFAPDVPTAAPTSNPAASDSEAPAKRRVHHSYIWLGSLRTFVAMLFAFLVAAVGSVVEAVTSASPNLAGIVMAVVVFAVGFLAVGALILAAHVWSYRHLHYEIGAEEFSLYSGIFTKRRKHIPYQRVQSVSSKATILQRLAGVCTVQIDTAGGAVNESATVPYLTTADAETLRLELFARKEAVIAGRPIPANVSAANALRAAGASGVKGKVASLLGVSPDITSSEAMAAIAQTPEGGNVLDGAAGLFGDVRGVWGGAAVDTGRVTYEHGLTNKELVMAAATNNTTFALIAIGVFGTLVQVMTFITERLGEQATNMALSLSANLPLWIIATAIVVLLGAVLVMWGISIAGTCVVYGGFRARRRDRRIEVEHGLLSRTFHGVDIDRVQSVIVKQGLIRRLFGYCEISLGKVDALAAGEKRDRAVADHQRGLVVHPFAKVDRVPEILAGLVPEFADVPTETISVARPAFRRALVRRCTWAGSGFWLAVATLATQAIVCNLLPAAGLYATDAFWVGVVATVSGFLYAVALLGIILGGVGAVLWYRDSGFAYNRRFMQITNGGLSRETVTFPRKKIQFGFVGSNPFQRRAHTATIHARTAVGVGTTLSLIDVSEEDAAAWLAWLRPGGNR